MHLEAAAVRRFLRSRRCSFSSAGSLIAARSGTSSGRFPLRRLGGSTAPADTSAVSILFPSWALPISDPLQFAARFSYPPYSSGSPDRWITRAAHRQLLSQVPQQAKQQFKVKSQALKLCRGVQFWVLGNQHTGLTLSQMQWQSLASEPLELALCSTSGEERGWLEHLGWRGLRLGALWKSAMSTYQVVVLHDADPLHQPRHPWWWQKTSPLQGKGWIQLRSEKATHDASGKRATRHQKLFQKL